MLFSFSLPKSARRRPSSGPSKYRRLPSIPRLRVGRRTRTFDFSVGRQGKTVERVVLGPRKIDGFNGHCDQGPIQSSMRVNFSQMKVIPI